MAESDDIICFEDDKTIALKRQLVAGNYPSAHSCCHCKIFVVPETTPLGNGVVEEFFQTPIQIDEIHRLAADGCRWFALFSNKLNCIAETGVEFVARGSRPDLPAIKESSVVIYMEYETYNEHIYINAILHQLWGEDLKTSFFGFKQPAFKQLDVNSHLRTSSLHPINPNPASDESIQLIRSWLEACSVKHNCGIQKLPPFLPKFLLAIGKERVHLMETAGRPRARYVALSYCWGDKKPNILLSSKNKQQLLGGTALGQLDTTIKEAIHITRQIGFPYLWIDSLCIAQDDEEEKSIEIQRMHEIYRNATLTLIPSRAAGVQESFLSKREIIGSSQSNLTFELPHFDKSSLSSAQGRTIILIPKEPLQGEMDACTMEPWSQRAWTLQEGIVSLRRLRFGLRQTTWTCCHAATQYMDNDGWLSTAREEDYDLIVHPECHNQACQVVNQEISRYQPEQVRSIWYEILAEYSHRRIKYQNDRLPAIASIARGFAQALDDDYICGLWKAHLHHGLLWHRRLDYDYDRDYDMSEYTSGFQPSWSWASSRRRIKRQDREIYKDVDFEVVRYDIVPKSEGDKYGAMESAVLHIRALVVPVPEAIINDPGANLTGLSNRPRTCSYQTRSYGRLVNDKEEYIISPRIRYEEAYVNDLSSMLECTYIAVDKGKTVLNEECYHWPHEELVDLSLLIVGHPEAVSRSRAGRPRRPSGGPAGLLIAKEKNGTYRRIGYFEAYNLWGNGDTRSWTHRSYSDTLNQDYRSRVLYLWGGQTNVREITLV
ncbi:HET-domain-containing protein [Xylaria sp. FL0933]|nr:HET-domain-containing protein [Xylaria sp. FL0933]